MRKLFTKHCKVYYVEQDTVFVIRGCMWRLGSDIQLYINTGRNVKSGEQWGGWAVLIMN